MKPVILVPGTWSDKWGEWWAATSAFVTLVLEPHGYMQFDRRDPFAWSTDLDGTWHERWTTLFKKRGAKHADWQSGGDALRYYVAAKLPSSFPVRVIAHSHGGNVAMYAAARGLYINSLVTVSTPVRKDMEAIYTQAAPNIGQHCHIYDPKDKIQWFGQMMDGRWGGGRSMPHATANLAIPGVGHSKLLVDPKEFHRWSEGLITWLS